MAAVSDSEASSRLPGGWLLQALPFAILGGAAIRIRLSWDRIPNRFAVHWTAHGLPDRWATKSVLGVYGVLLMGVAGCAILVAISYGMGLGLKKLRAAGAGASAAGLNQGTMLWTFIGVEFFLALMLGWTAMLPLRANPDAQPNIPLIVSITLVLALIIILQSVRMQRRKHNLKSASSARKFRPAASPQTELEKSRQNRRYWKAGMFYVNREDPSIFVEKIEGVGYTLNFGHPAAWLFFAVLLFLPLAIALLLSH
ncbi:MAG: DUF5808 domain-containing protein [Terriglobia bacterium]